MNHIINCNLIQFITFTIIFLYEYIIYGSIKLSIFLAVILKLKSFQFDMFL